MLTPTAARIPTRRPCPSWCWIAREEDYEHEVACEHPLEASHTLEPHPSLAASLYRGTSISNGSGKYIHATTTIEPRLQQLGQGAPVVNVAFRQCEGGEQKYEDEFLRSPSPTHVS